jgi:hypothetical protein
MDRRTLLRAVPAAGVAGCLGAPRNGDGSLRVTGRSFRDTGRCERPETASVDRSDGQVRIAGCVTGPNGCAKARLDAATIEDDVLEVVVGTYRDAPPDVACTEALVYREYEATIEFAGGSPATVRVVHDAPGGRRTVAETSA